MENLEVKYFYGNYYIANRGCNQYLLLDIKKKKVTVLDELQFNIVSLLAEIKCTLKELYDGFR